jgi:hypothetical protein
MRKLNIQLKIKVEYYSESHCQIKDAKTTITLGSTTS